MNSEDLDSIGLYISDKYTLEEKLGSGSFSTVYKAIQTATGQNVAVKILRFTQEDSEEEKARQMERFRREMQICGKLYHPAVVSVLDFGQTPEGIFFTVFEYIPGQTLSALIEKEGALTVKRTLAIMLQVLEGLAVAHEQGVIHRDLKPENIMVTVAGSSEQAKILDFGISTFSPELTGEFNRVTMTREFLGTPVYSAPEQLRAARVTFKSDLYSWGLVFLKCLLGRHPYGETSVADVIQKQLSNSPVPMPPELMAHPLGMILRWVLEKDVDRRTGDAGHLMARIRKIPVESIASLHTYLGEFAFSTAVPKLHREYNVPEPVRIDIDYRRRAVTVLCLSLDFVVTDTGTNTTQLDEVYFPIRKTCVELVTDLNGHLLGECGGQLLFVFGYPVADEQDAKLAGNAALKLAELVVRFNLRFKQRAGAEIKHRIGVHVGEMLEPNQSAEQPAGYVFWMTRQLCNIAGEGEIIASDDAIEVLKEDMAVATVQQNTPEKLPFPGKLYRIKGRLEAFGKRFSESRRTQMFGRQRELGMLMEYYASVQAGEGSAILIQGDAGEGKTRLLEEFASYVRSRGGSYMEIVCTPETRHSPLYPVIHYVRKLLLPSKDLATDRTAAYVERSLRKRGLASRENVGLFCAWFGVSHPSCPPPECSPQKKTALLLNAVCALLIEESKSTRSVILIEDLHWADNATVSFLGVLISSVQQNGRLLVMSARNSFHPEWSASDVCAHQLSPLQSDSIHNIVRAIDEKGALPNDLRTKIIRKAEGVPLFAEELTHAAVDQVRDEKNARTTDRISQVTIPDNLKELLTSKLDRLGNAKRSAQLASVIGRDFPYSVLAALSEADETKLLADLDELVSAGILHVNYYEGEFYYMFHHSLVRDAAYDSLSRSGKQLIHKRLSEVLENRLTDFAAAHPDQMAVHLACAGEYTKAVEYAYLSAEKSLSHSFYSETIDHVEQAMEWAEKLTSASEANEAKLRLHQLKVPALTATTGYASQELLEALHNAESWLEDIPESSELRFPVLWGMIIYCHSRPIYEKFDILLDAAFKVAEAARATNDLAALHAIKGHREFSKGRFKACDTSLSIALKLYKPADGNAHANRYGHDIRIFALSTRTLLYTAMGAFKEAEETINEALAWGREMDSAQSTAMAMAYEIGMWHYRNNPKTVAELAGRLVQYARAKDVTMWNFIASFLGGWAHRSVKDIEEGLMLFKSLGIGQFASYWHFPLAQVHCANGEYRKSLSILDEYIEQANQVEELFYLPELYRQKAEVLRLSGGYSGNGGTSFAKKAVSVAKSTGAKLFELRAYLELSKLMNVRTFIQHHGNDLERLVHELDASSPVKELTDAKFLLDSRA